MPKNLSFSISGRFLKKLVRLKIILIYLGIIEEKEINLNFTLKGGFFYL